MKRKYLLPFLFLFSLLATVATVSADTFDLMEVPTYIDNQFGCGEFVGGLIASVFLLLLTLIPVIILTRGRSQMYGLYVLVGLSVLAPLVGLGWFPVWLYVIIVIALSVGLGRMIAGAIGGLRH